MFGNPETTTGGNALKFYASLRLDVRRIEAIKDGTNVVGNRTRVKVVKNKVAPPFREAQFDILYNEGISKLGDLIDVAVDHNIIGKSGSWFSYKEDRIGQGRDAVKKYLQENGKLAKEIEFETRKKLGLVPTNGHKRPEQTQAAHPAAPAKTDDAARRVTTQPTTVVRPEFTKKK
jgi:recombination protein RecA